MATEATDNKEGQSETEDIPSDFFDDFNKEEFIEGLSVIDSWDDDAGKRRINAETVESVKDLRELIRDGKPVRRDQNSGGATSSERNNRSSSQDLNRFIKPGSRRDPEKTNEAIKKDKDMKVKEYLAKSLESTDDIRPPGTELDDFFVANSEKKALKKEVKEETQVPRSRSPRERRARESPPRAREPLYRPRRTSPPHRRASPPRRLSPRRKDSPPRRRELSPRRRESPRHYRKSPIRVRRFSPSRRSPRRSPRRGRRSRSPYGRSPDRRRSRSRSPAYRRSPNRDNFLYPDSKKGPPHSAPYGSSYPPSYGPPPHWEGAPPGEYPAPGPGYPYPAMGPPPPGAAYPGGYGGYDYSQPQPPGMPGMPPVPGVPAPAPYAAPGYIPPAPVPAPQPVPAPVPTPVLPPPAMVPAPVVPTPAPVYKPPQVENSNSKKTPYDALAQVINCFVTHFLFLLNTYMILCRHDHALLLLIMFI